MNTKGICCADQSGAGAMETGWTLQRQPAGWKKPLYALARFSLINKALLLTRMTRDTWTLAKNCFYDFNRVRRYSSAVRTGDTRDKQRALITMAYHGIEKGLSLPQPRPGFGKDLVQLLVSRLERYGAQFGFDETAVVAYNALGVYLSFNSTHGVRNPELEQRVQGLRRYVEAVPAPPSDGGVKRVTRTELLEVACIDGEAFFGSRSSVRQYAPLPVDLGLIRKAVEMAKRTPSCCNRQSAKVWVIHRKEQVDKALDIQGGARGFKDQVPMVLVVTSDLAAFQSSGERYQSWIDGGLFGMSLVYALHSLGLVSCILNWSKRFETDRRFRKEFGFPPNETIIFLVSVGHPKDEFNVAQSHRRATDEVMVVL